MPIGIKKVGMISDTHIPSSLRRRAFEFEPESEAERIYTEAGEDCGRAPGTYLVLAVSCSDFSWRFHTWPQAEVSIDCGRPAANPQEAEFVQNIYMLQKKYDLDHVESPELCPYRVDELPTYPREEDEDNEWEE
jgi:hypothetical protein